ncbi:MAG: hypothetical protein LBF16_04690, partial [Pseudomonadales bacterium]|nr:hypothetical protein [Pseudomonadales bacterium]
MSNGTPTAAQRDATELLSILEFLGGEDDANWDALRGTLSGTLRSAELGTEENASVATATAAPDNAKDSNVKDSNAKDSMEAKPVADAPQGLDLAQAATTTGKKSALK